jgi:hypothetical protein
MQKYKLSFMSTINLKVSSPVSPDIGNCALPLGTNGLELAKNCNPNILYYKDL